MPTLRQAIKGLRDRWILPTIGTVSVRDLNQRFQPIPPGSMRSLLLKMNMLADVAEPAGGSTHPYYRRSMPAPYPDASLIDSNTAYIDLTNDHLPPYVELNTVAEAVRKFDARAAAAVSASCGSIEPYKELLEFKSYGGEAPDVWSPMPICLAMMAYPDYFPGINVQDFPRMVSEAILASNPGWCGTYGPGVHGTSDFVFGDPSEGNYDMSQMHLLQIAYRYYDELFPEAREFLIKVLLAKGLINRINEDDIVTSGGAPVV